MAAHFSLGYHRALRFLQIEITEKETQNNGLISPCFFSIMGTPKTLFGRNVEFTQDTPISKLKTKRKHGRNLLHAQNAGKSQFLSDVVKSIG
jgi:hypothetical protein